MKFLPCCTEAAGLSCLWEIEQRPYVDRKIGEQQRQLNNITYLQMPQIDAVVQAHDEGGHDQNREERYHWRHHHSQHVDHCSSLLQRLWACLLTAPGVGGALLPKKPNQAAETSEHYNEEEALHEADCDHNNWYAGLQTCKKSRNKNIKIQNCYRDSIWLSFYTQHWNLMMVPQWLRFSAWLDSVFCQLLPVTTQKQPVTHHTREDTAIRYSHFFELKYSRGFTTAT